MTKKLHNPKAYAPAVYIPCWLIQVPSKLLSHAAKMLYGRLAQWSNTKGTVYRSVPQLSQELGTEKRQIDRYIKELKDVGLIGTFHPQKGGVNHFQFYDHEWMYAPITDELSYNDDPTTNMSLGNDKNDVTPTTNMSSINIKEIKTNYNKHKRQTSNEVALRKIKKNSFQSEQNNNQTLTHSEDDEIQEGSDLPTKSDYQKNQAKNKSNLQKIEHYGINNILQDNIFQIPEQTIRDWIENRKKKRVAVTKTAWNKITKELIKCKEKNIDPLEAFETMVASGWQSLKVEYFDTQNKPTSQWDIDSVMRA